MRSRRFFSIILTLVLILGLVPASVRAREPLPRKDELYVYTAADRAKLDTFMFSGISEVVESARKRIGAADELNANGDPSRTVLTEADYIALIPEVIEAVKSSEIYAEGSLQQNGVFLIWETTLGMPCCFDPRLEAELDNDGFRTSLVPGEETMSAREILPDEEPKAEIMAGIHYSASKEIALITPYWDSDTNYKEKNHGTLGKGKDTRDQWEKLCDEYGSSKDYRYTMGNATVDNIAKAIEECAYVMFHSHGDTDYSDGKGDCTSRANCSYICLTTSAGITSEDTAAQKGPYGQYHHALYTASGAMVSGTCVTNHMTKKAPGNYVHLGMCLGMATDGLCRPLRNAGVEAVLGFSQTVKTSYDGDFIREVMSHLGEGSLLSAAVEEAKIKLGRWDDTSTTTVPEAQAHRDAFPIVVSSEDPYPGHGNVDNLQDVHSSWSLYEPGTRSFLTAADVTRVEMTKNALIPGMSVGVWARVNEEYHYLPTEHLGFVWQVSADETNWEGAQEYETGTGFSSFTEALVGYWVRAKVTPRNQEGHNFTMYSAPVRISEKLANLSTPAPPVVQVRSYLPYLSLVAGQEYVIKNTNSEPTESEWAGGIKATQDGEKNISLDSTANSLNYVFTRFSETDSSYAGEQVASTVYWYGLSSSTLQATKLQITPAATPSGAHTDGFRVSDVLKVDVQAVPDNAPFDGFPGSTWYYPLIYDKTYGIFYEDLACTAEIQSDKVYKTVYLKLLKAGNGNAISCGTTSTKGCYTMIDVADQDGKYAVSSVSVPEYSVQIGTLVTGLPFSFSPNKAGASVDQLYAKRNNNAQENGSTGTEPIVSFNADGTMTVDTNPCEEAPYSLIIYDGITNAQVGRMRIWVGDFDTTSITRISFREKQVTCYAGRWVTLDLDVEPDNGTGLLEWSVLNESGGICTFATVNGPAQTTGHRCSAYVNINELAKSGDKCIVWAKYGALLSASCEITVMDPPKIITQPQDETCYPDETAEFTVVASGDDVTYQWYYKEKDSYVWIPLTEENDAALKVYAGKYADCLFCCKLNGGMEISWDAKLTVLNLIEHAEITVDAPFVGNLPDYDAALPSGVNYYTRTQKSGTRKNDVAWYDTTAKRYLIPDQDRFESGHLYRIEIDLLADQHYQFADWTQGTINGNPASFSNYYYGKDDSAGIALGHFQYTFKPLEPEAVRLYGKTRYATAAVSADYLRAQNGGKQFDTVIVAYGENHADALSGSFLSSLTGAPILLVSPKQEKTVLKSIGNNLKPGGTVYLLGGTAVITEQFFNAVKTAGFNPVRLGGSTRYATNIQILKEAAKLGGNMNELLVCSSTSYADALSVSSVGKPILLVDKKLNKAQKSYLSGLTFSRIYIVGGTLAVSETIENEMKSYLTASGSMSRFSGSNRYATSKLVADTFFKALKRPAVLVYGQNFPDGLSGGPVAMRFGAPVLLVEDKKTGNAASWVKAHQSYRCLVLGGPTLISDESVGKVLNREGLPVTVYGQ